MIKALLKSLNQRPIAFQPVYVKITGDHASAVVLSQIVYWWSVKGGGEFYKTDAELMEECLLSEKQMRRVKTLLKSIPWVKITLRGVPAKTYYDIDYDSMAKNLINPDKVWGETTSAQKGETGTAQKGETTSAQKGETITKTTTKTTGIEVAASGSQSPIPGYDPEIDELDLDAVQSSAPITTLKSGHKPLPKKKTTSDEIKKQLVKEKPEPNLNLCKPTNRALYFQWALTSMYNVGFATQITGKSRGQLTTFYKKAGEDAASIFRFVLKDWGTFVAGVKIMSGKDGPSTPSTSFMVMHVQEAVSLYNESLDSSQPTTPLLKVKPVKIDSKAAEGDKGEMATLADLMTMGGDDAT